MIPLGDEPNPRGTAWVNWMLIGLNVAIYLTISLPLSYRRPDPLDPRLPEYARLIARSVPNEREFHQAIAGVSEYDLVVVDHGYRPAKPEALDLLSSMFLHSGFLHLAGNLLFLWIYGDNVENRLGRIGYLAAYLTTGAAATLTHSLFSSGSLVPMIGASGAISGVLGCYFVWFPKNRVRVLAIFPPFFVDVWKLPARLVLGIYLVIDNLFPFFLSQSDRGVAYGAHIGGFVAGLGLAWLLGSGEASVVPAGGPTSSSNGDPAARIGALVSAGKLDEATRGYLDLWRTEWRSRVDPTATLTIADELERRHWDEVALAVYQRYLADHPHGPYRDRAHLGAGLLLLERLQQPTAAWQHLLDARESTHDPRVRDLALEAIDAIERMQKRKFRGK